MESNDIITVHNILESYERLNLASRLKRDSSKLQNGLIEIFADRGEKIDFKSSDYKDHWPKLKTYYSYLIEKLRDGKKNKKKEAYWNITNLNDIFYSKAKFPRLCFKKSR